MFKRQGFTLVELLVVIAIIAILATIVVPNVARYISRSRAVNALADIRNTELAITTMLADAGRNDLGELFNPNGVANRIAPPPWNAEMFRAAVEMYSGAVYTLLRLGRGALNDEYGDILNQTAVRQLGTSYLDLGFDPWGELYRIYPGPWPARNGLIPFRIYLDPDVESRIPGSTGRRPDRLTLNVQDFETEQALTVGFPAPRDKVAFIWSTGANLRSGQAIYRAEAVLGNIGNPDAQYPGDPIQYYDVEQDPEFLGGGDDVNNWDPNQTWGRFYN